MTIGLTESPPRKATLKEVVILSYPIIISMASIALMGLTDTLFMGWLGPREQAAVGLGSPLAFSLLSFFYGVWSGVSIFVAQAIGAKKPEFCGKIFWHAIVLAALSIPIVLWGMSANIEYFLHLFKANPEVVPEASSYLGIRLNAAPFLFVGFIGVSFLRGAGDTKSPAIITVIALFLNVPFTYVLSFGWGSIPALGVAGAAYGTVLSQIFETFAYLYVIMRKKNNDLYQTRKIPQLEWAVFRKFLFISVPIGVTWILEHVGWIVFTLFVSTLPKEALAAHTIVYQILNVCFMPGLAISIATATLVGQYMGANDPHNAQRSAQYSIRLAIVIMVSLGLIILVFQYPIATAFSKHPEVIAIARQLFIFGAVYQIFDALNMAAGGALRGAGDTRFPMYISILTIWFGMIPGIYLFGSYLGYGVYGAWMAATGVIILLGIFYYARFRRGKWKTMRVLPAVKTKDKLASAEA